MSGQAAVELKGGMYTLLSLQIHSIEADAIELALKNKVQQAPGFFKETPIVIDLSPVEHMPELDTDKLLQLVKDYNLVAIAARVNDKSSPAACSIKLPVLDAGGPRADKSADTAEQDKDGAKDTPATPELTSGGVIDMPVAGPTIVTRPVRSGQQVYAQGGELVVLGQAGPGAELIADSNIHVYGPLRGRALCGVTGNTDARIFCRSLEAELVSVAGNYKPLEEIPADLKGKPAQIWLDGDRLVIEALK
ncbi:septum site-determining protein MinC [Granulosicoccaceae sp. 1_MG-2023]|nr:septum site-determining protein MinC [Granulosicoccaceae sp. 1_MG-2023]